MALIVKICGLSTPETLAAANEAGADMVGFVFFPPSPRHVSFERARDLASRSRGRALKVALSVNADDAMLDSIVKALAPDILQLHGTETPGRVAEVRRRYGLPIMKAIGVSIASDLAAIDAYRDVADRMLLDAKPPKDATRPGGNARTFDWGLLAGRPIDTPWMLSGGLDPENVAEAIRLTGASAVDVSSGVEISPGVKDAARIRAFIAAARAALGSAGETP